MGSLTLVNITDKLVSLLPYISVCTINLYSAYEFNLMLAPESFGNDFGKCTLSVVSKINDNKLYVG